MIFKLTERNNFVILLDNTAIVRKALGEGQRMTRKIFFAVFITLEFVKVQNDGFKTITT
jgi:hypothetical protein